jgi:hypothetical protein
MHETVSLSNDLDQERRLLAKVEMEDLLGSAANEISMLTQLSKLHLKALPMPHQESITPLSERFLNMFSVGYTINGKLVGKGADSSIKKAKYNAAVSALKNLAPHLYEQFLKVQGQDFLKRDESDQASQEEKAPVTSSSDKKSPNPCLSMDSDEDYEQSLERLT